jgi:hypothetical protein
MALHNPSSRENHISRIFAIDLGFPIPEPPDIPSVEVSWSSSTLRRFDETTTFMVAGPASFKLLFGREERTLQRGTSRKNRSRRGKDKVEQSRSISFRDGIKSGLLYQVELADSDSLESGASQWGPKLADVEARLQSDHSVSTSMLEKYFEPVEDVHSTTDSEPAHKSFEQAGNLGSTTDSWVHSTCETIEMAQADGTHELHVAKGNREHAYAVARKTVLAAGPATATAVQTSATPPANRYAVLEYLPPDSPNTSSSKKQRKKRKSPSKKVSQTTEGEAQTQPRISDHSDPMSTSSYAPVLRDVPGPDLRLSSTQHPEARNSASSESGQSNFVYSSKAGPSNLSRSPEEHYTPCTSPEEHYISYPRESYEYNEYYNHGTDIIPRSSKTSFQDDFEENPESDLQHEMPESSPWMEGVEVTLAQDTHRASSETAKQAHHIPARPKRKTGSKKRKS